MFDARATKQELRRSLRQRRAALSRVQQQTAARALAESAIELPAWNDAKHIALYLCTDGEVDTTALALLARTAGKALYLPAVSPHKTLSFRLWEPAQSLLSNRYGIAEPPADAGTCDAADLDIIFLPLVGWDLQGGRLGMGGGYYDRTLAGISGPIRVGAAHTCQQVSAVPREAWDITLQFTATDTALHRCEGLRKN